MYTTELKLAAEPLEISWTSPVALADGWKFVMLMLCQAYAKWLTQYNAAHHATLKAS